MFQRQAHIELFGNADGGKDIVGLVCMGFQGMVWSSTGSKASSFWL